MYKNAKENNPGKECNVLVVFGDQIAVMIGNKKFSPIVIRLFIRRRKKNLSLIFITQSHIKEPKGVRTNSTL